MKNGLVRALGFTALTLVPTAAAYAQQPLDFDTPTTSTSRTFDKGMRGYEPQHPKLNITITPTSDDAATSTITDLTKAYFLTYRAQNAVLTNDDPTTYVRELGKIQERNEGNKIYHELREDYHELLSKHFAISKGSD